MGLSANTTKLEIAILAGGCFWCMEPPFENLDGVTSVLSGYAGGKERNPKYQDVASGKTGHREAVKITFDPSKTSYEKILEVFWRSVDPTDSDGQFADRGHQYKTAIFYTSDQQKQIAEKSKLLIGKSGRFTGPIMTQLIKHTDFYPAEEYHQDYYKKNETHYKSYRFFSGRESFLKKTWAEPGPTIDRSPPAADLKKRLTALQYKVTQKDGTEPAFDNAYWENKEKGLYVDIVSGEPLFSSNEKYDSGTGWPSFYKPIEPENIIEKKDRKLFVERIEVRSRKANSHLGHVFKDGPAPTGLRYCINSAALKFIPVEELEKNGYQQYLKLFKDKKNRPVKE